VFKYLGEKVKIYPIIGNHDVFPANVMSFDHSNENIAIRGFEIIWRKFISEESVDSFKRFGYYSEFLTFPNGS